MIFIPKTVKITLLTVICAFSRQISSKCPISEFDAGLDLDAYRRLRTYEEEKRVDQEYKNLLARLEQKKQEQSANYHQEKDKKNQLLSWGPDEKRLDLYRKKYNLCRGKIRLIKTEQLITEVARILKRYGPPYLATLPLSIRSFTLGKVSGGVFATTPGGCLAGAGVSIMHGYSKRRKIKKTIGALEREIEELKKT